MTYKNLKQQIEAYLERKGPSHVSKVTMGLRHNATAADINAEIDKRKKFVRFTYSYHSYRRTYHRNCVRLTSQAEADYRDEYTFS